jgi:hypothetical protein
LSVGVVLLPSNVTHPRGSLCFYKENTKMTEQNKSIVKTRSGHKKETYKYNATTEDERKANGRQRKTDFRRRFLRCHAGSGIV